MRKRQPDSLVKLILFADTVKQEARFLISIATLKEL
jgi:hypothetical protein